jgi:CMP/dCMP kinase
MAFSKKIIIAVDGPSASGKGTIAARLAEELNLAHMDTGAIYRLVGQQMLVAGLDTNDKYSATTAAKALEKTFSPDMLRNDSLKSDEVGQAASQIAQWQGVRDALFKLQVSFAHNPPPGKDGTILDGRDIGTTIAPDADVKLYITAKMETRAERRRKELQSKGFDVTYEAILADMRVRDTRDQERKIVPAKAADDAIIVDTSDLNAYEAFNEALEIILSKLS